jgi:NADH dehydrogenase [ubiquinone] 1 alpha subcomplex assembly factor 3
MKLNQTRPLLASKRTFSVDNQQTEKQDFLKRWDRMVPPAHELFDRKMKIYGMQDNYFLVNHYWVPGSVIVFPQRYFMWNVLDASEIKPHTLEIMQFIKPRPDYLIIGTGDETIHFDDAFYEHFKRLGISVDTCPSVSLQSVCLAFFSSKRAARLICASRMTTM